MVKALFLIAALVGILALVGAMLWWDRGYGQRIRAGWQRAGADLGLTWTPPTSGGPGSLSGTIDGLPVSVQRLELKVNERTTRSVAVTRIRTGLGGDLGEGLAVVRRWMPPQTLADVAALKQPLPALSPPLDPALEGEVRAAARALGDLGLDGDALVTTLRRLETDPQVIARAVRTQVALAGRLRAALSKR